MHNPIVPDHVTDDGNNDQRQTDHGCPVEGQVGLVGCFHEMNITKLPMQGKC